MNEIKMNLAEITRLKEFMESSTLVDEFLKFNHLFSSSLLEAEF